MRRAIDLEVEGQRKKEGQRGHRNSRLMENLRRLISEGKMHFADQSGVGINQIEN